ncbi:MAG: P1 family peptidase [Actinomycetota bacterium]
MSALPAGVTVGHWDDAAARTGCTVVLLPEGTVASGEVRGDAPATRELDLLGPSRTVQHADAVVMSGGSAFGLSVADGVMAWLVEHDRGYPTDGGRVPIVPTMALYDLAVGQPGPDGVTTRRPGPDEGRAACEAATTAPTSGRVGAGCGATVRKWLGPDDRLDGGLGIAARELDGVEVTAIAAVNAFGDLVDRAEADLAADRRPSGQLFSTSNTTLVTVLTDAPLDKRSCHAVARSGHDGLARALLPVHTAGDGDAVIACATGTGREAPVETVRLLTVLAVDAAIRAALGPLNA